jgi:hypothetical protein
MRYHGTWLSGRLRLPTSPRDRSFSKKCDNPCQSRGTSFDNDLQKSLENAELRYGMRAAAIVSACRVCQATLPTRDFVEECDNPCQSRVTSFSSDLQKSLDNRELHCESRAAAIVSACRICQAILPTRDFVEKCDNPCQSRVTPVALDLQKSCYRHGLSQMPHAVTIGSRSGAFVFEKTDNSCQPVDTIGVDR